MRNNKIIYNFAADNSAKKSVMSYSNNDRHC